VTAAADDPFVAPTATQPAGERWSRRRLLIVVGAIACAASMVAAVFVVHQIAVRSYYIPSGSMEPTLQIGDHVADNRLAYRFGHHVQRGDIVLLDNTTQLGPLGEGGQVDTSIHFIKRVVAFENEEIRCCDAGGHVLVDGQPLAEPYTLGDTTSFRPVRVPAGDIFVLGDHRPASADSRQWGPVALDSVDGKILSVRGTTAQLLPFIVAGACALVITMLALLGTLTWDMRRRRKTT
jgi:signal peptidase I